MKPTNSINFQTDDGESLHTQEWEDQQERMKEDGDDDVYSGNEGEEEEDSEEDKPQLLSARVGIFDIEVLENVASFSRD